MQQIIKKDLPVKKTEITWVLTVPAIWSDPAKQFMREAAVKVCSIFRVILDISISHWLISRISPIFRHPIDQTRPSIP